MSDIVRQAVVLAGGLGTRLGSLTAETPKPLLPVGGRPFLDWVAMNLRRQGVEDVVLTVGYRSEAFDPWIARWEEELSVRTFVEESPLGTGGALPMLRDDLEGAFLVLNGDTLFDAPLQRLAGSRAEADALGAVALRSVPDVGRYGEAVLEGSAVARFREKPREGPGLINGGVYAFAREALDLIGSPASIEQDLLPRLVERRSLRGLPSDGFFIDIGVPQSYDEAQHSVPDWWEGVHG